MSDPSDRIGLVFVGGISAFGPELLQRLLAAHPQIATGPEFPHLPELLDLRRRMYVSIDRGWIDLFCSREDVDAQLRSFLEKLVYQKVSDPCCRLLSEGAPHNVAVFPELAQLFPEARLIHVVSDPREAVASRLEADDRDDRRFRRVSQRWKRLEATLREVEAALEAGFRAAREAPERVANVSCDELLRDPEQPVRQLCRFLGIDWKESMIGALETELELDQRMRIRADPAVARRMRDESRGAGTRGGLAPLTAGEQVAVSKVFQHDPNLARFGYDLSLRRLGLGARLLGNLTSSLGSSASKLERLGRRVLRKLRRSVLPRMRSAP